MDTLRGLDAAPMAVKGQVTGPITFCTGVKDQNGRAIYYNETLREAAVKHLALNAYWQIRTLSGSGCPVMIFIDESALAGFGSSELISISRQQVLFCLKEMVDAIHSNGGLAGIHVCANTDWALVLDSGADIVNFDAYAYFDRFILYGSRIRHFLSNGGLLAWGIIPTMNPEEVRHETVETLHAKLLTCFRQVEALGVDLQTIHRQSIITPGCGLGSLDPNLAKRVLLLTRDVAAAVCQTIRNQTLKFCIALLVLIWPKTRSVESFGKLLISFPIKDRQRKAKIQIHGTNMDIFTCRTVLFVKALAGCGLVSGQ